MTHNENIKLSIIGILYDMNAGAMSLEQAVAEVESYFVEATTDCDAGTLTRPSSIDT